MHQLYNQNKGTFFQGLSLIKHLATLHWMVVTASQDQLINDKVLSNCRWNQPGRWHTTVRMCRFLPASALHAIFRNRYCIAIRFSKKNIWHGLATASLIYGIIAVKLWLWRTGFNFIICWKKRFIMVRPSEASEGLYSSSALIVSLIPSPKTTAEKNILLFLTGKYASNSKIPS